MTVLMPNVNATVLRRQEAGFDDHGERVRAGFGGPLAMKPARVRENSDGTWAIGVDTALWPVRQGDVILDSEGRSFLVDTSAKITNNVRSDVDWVRVTAMIRSVEGTVPTDSWFVGRVGEGAVEDPPDPVAGLFTGHGPPPEGLIAEVGDEYLDLDSGNLYELRDE